MENIKEAIEDLKLEIKSNEEELPYSKEVLQRNKILLNYIEQLEKENEELTENYNVLEKAYNDEIPKSVIRDKIEETNQEDYFKKYYYDYQVNEYDFARGYKKCLKEILGDE